MKELLIFMNKKMDSKHMKLQQKHPNEFLLAQITELIRTKISANTQRTPASNRLTTRHRSSSALTLC
jgi:hypothetical protein